MYVKNHTIRTYNQKDIFTDSVQEGDANASMLARSCTQLDALP